MLEIAAKWRACSQRERILLVLLAILVAVFAAWYGVASPLRRAAASAHAERAHAAEQLAMTETAVRELAGDQGPQPLPAGGIEEAVTVSAVASGITLKRTRVENTREITVWTDAIEPMAFFAWVKTLQKAHGLAVVNLTAMRDDDGALDVEVRFSGGAG